MADIFSFLQLKVLAKEDIMNLREAVVSVTNCVYQMAMSRTYAHAETMTLIATFTIKIQYIIVTAILEIQYEITKMYCWDCNIKLKYTITPVFKTLPLRVTYKLECYV